METDLERYAWLVAYELREARSAATPEERRDHEGLARAYTIKMHALENESPPFLLRQEDELPPDEPAADGESEPDLLKRLHAKPGSERAA